MNSDQQEPQPHGLPAQPADLNPRLLMYPRSRLIERLEWMGPTHKLPGTGSDMHWNAWAEDGSLWVVDDDGHNGEGPWSFCHLLRVTGQPPQHQATVASRFPGLQRYSMRRHLYVNGALAVGRRIYVAAYEYESHDPANPPVTLKGNQLEGWEDPGFLFIDAISHHGGVASLMYSDDDGRTFENYPQPHAPHFLGPRFAGLAFVGFGPGYSGVPASLGEYVYAISNDEGWECGSHVFLARVPRDRVLDRTTWEFYGGRQRSTNTPAWVREEAYARPIMTDYGHVGHPSMVYVPGLERFILAFGSDAVTKSYAHDLETARALWHRRRELQVYEGPTPWGPWSLVHYEPFWGGGTHRLPAAVPRLLVQRFRHGGRLSLLRRLPYVWLALAGARGVLVRPDDPAFPLCTGLKPAASAERKRACPRQGGTCGAVVRS